MKNLLQIVTACFIMLASSTAMATTDCTNMLYNTPAGPLKDALMISCIENATALNREKQSLQEAVMSVDMDKASEMATKYATALGVAAREVGMAANEFMDTDAGKLATFAIIWTIFGEDIRGVVFAPLIVLALFIFWKMFITRLVGGEYKTYMRGRWFREGKVEDIKWVPTKWDDIDGGQATMLVLSTIALAVMGTATLINGLL